MIIHYILSKLVLLQHTNNHQEEMRLSHFQWVCSQCSIEKSSFTSSEAINFNKNDRFTRQKLNFKKKIYKTMNFFLKK